MTKKTSAAPSLAAVIVAAGSSRRMGFDKITTPVLGRPLVALTIERLLLSSLISELVVVVRPDTEEILRSALNLSKSSIPCKFVHGGKDRQDSVQAGLSAISPNAEYVLIHDAARPLVNPELVEKIFAAAQEHGAAVCGCPSTDTLKEAAADGRVVRTVDRSKIWAVQTPQIFRRSVLAEGYAAVRKGGGIVTDDTAAAEAAGYPVQIVTHQASNLKVTNPEDWKLAAACLDSEKKPATDPLGQQLRGKLHDLNNHMTALMGYSFLLSREISSEHPLSKYAEHLNTAAEKLHHTALDMQTIVRQLYPRDEELETQEAESVASQV